MQVFLSSWEMIFLKEYTCCKLCGIKMSVFKVRYYLISSSKNRVYITQQEVYPCDSILCELKGRSA